MRIGILADIHSNLSALEAVLRHAETLGAQDFWCLGDIVGYGPDPNQCVRMIEELASACVAGNHDLAAIGLIDVSGFNPQAAAAAEWTAGQLGSEERQFLESLPQVAQEGDFTLAHGTLRDPVWEYLYTSEAASAHLALQETAYGLVGHTHIPRVACYGPDGCSLQPLADGALIRLAKSRLVINPGSAGQPRDGDPRASYAIYDQGATTVALYRVEYDIPATQAKMAKAGLPSWLIERLSLGR